MAATYRAERECVAAPLPLWTATDRVSPVPVFSLNYGAILAIAPIFLFGSARDRGARRTAMTQDLEFCRSYPAKGECQARA